AVSIALARAGLPRDQALVDVLSQGGETLPGERVSAAEARVRVRPAPPEAVAARRHLEELLARMEVDATVTVARSPHADPGPYEMAAPVTLEVEGSDLGVLIGWRGESLRALQTIINLMVSQGAPGGPRVIVDVAHYRERRERAVAQTARRVAADVVRTGRPAALDPMPPYERRAVHIALAADPLVLTESSGVDEARRVTIRPAGGSDPVPGPGRLPVGAS
ncbi:MAG: Jag family protein, partial [Candidatus Dormibacteria bacterium]